MPSERGFAGTGRSSVFATDERLRGDGSRGQGRGRMRGRESFSGEARQVAGNLPQGRGPRTCRCLTVVSLRFHHSHPSRKPATSGRSRMPQGHGTRLRDGLPHRGGLVAVLVKSIAWIKSSVKIAGASFMLEVIFIVEESPEGGYTARRWERRSLPRPTTGASSRPTCAMP